MNDASNIDNDPFNETGEIETSPLAHFALESRRSDPVFLHPEYIPGRVEVLTGSPVEKAMSDILKMKPRLIKIYSWFFRNHPQGWTFVDEQSGEEFNISFSPERYDIIIEHQLGRFVFRKGGGWFSGCLRDEKFDYKKRELYSPVTFVESQIPLKMQRILTKLGHWN